MPKPGKSSASSATRKKHALKAAKAQGAEPPVPLPKTKKGKKADVPPVKMYIPPVKPTAPRPDPLDARGLASQLPADLVVVLRKFGKKDAITKRRGLEELQAEWVDRVSLSSGDEEEYLLGVLEVALPVWYHHYPSLVMHASRIIRSLAVSLHASLLAIPSLRTSVLYFLSDVADTAQLDQLVGAWSMSAFDLDTPVATKARKSWDDLISWTGAGDTQIPRGVVPYVSSVATFVQQAVMAPASIYLTFNPPAPEAPVVTPRARGGKQAGRSPATPISRREPDQAGAGKTDPDEEEEGDRNARYRVGAMGVLRWILEIAAPSDTNTSESKEVGGMEGRAVLAPLDSLFGMLADGVFWSSLHHARRPPWFSEESVYPGVGFGHGYPSLRRAAWGVVKALSLPWKERLAPMLSTISVVLLRSAWVEPDAGVRAVMREPLLLFLRNYPQAWLLEASANAAKASLDKDDEDVDSGDEAVPSATTKNLSQFSMAYREFLDYLKLGCGGSPTQGFPTVLIVLSTIPNELLSMEQDSLRVLFDSFWAAVDGRALSSLDRGAFPAFLSSLLECLLFCLRKIRSHDSAAGEAEPEEQENTLSINLVMGQFTEVWNSLGTSRLHLEARAAGDILARTLLRLEDVDKVLCLHAWSTIAASTMESVQHPTEEKAKDTWSFKFDCLGTIDEKLPSQPIARKEISHLLDELVKWGLAQLRQSSQGPGGLDRATIVLSTLIDKFWPSLSQDSKQLLDAYFLGDSGSLQLQLSSANSVGLLLAYLGANAESPNASTVWHLSLEQLQASFIATGDLSGLKVLLDHAGRGTLSRFPLRANQELDVLAETILLEVEGGHGSEKATFLGQLLAQPDIFVNDSTAGQVIRRISHLISKRVSTVFKQETPLGSTARCLEVLLPLFTAKSPRCRLASPILPELLLFAYVAPLYDEGEDELEYCISSSQRICSVWKDSQPTNVADVRQALFARIHEMIQDVDVRISATDIVEAAASLEFQSALESGPSGLQSIIPPQTTFTALFDQSLIGYIDEPTALYNPSLRQPMLPHLSFDKWGFSSYARLTTALLHTFSLDHHFSPHQTWALKHLSLLERLADDYASDSEVDNAMFGPDANRGHVERIQEEAARIQTYAFATLMNDVEAGWHVSLCNRLRRGKGKSNSEDDPLVNLVEEIYFDALANEVSNVKGCRLLRRVLHALLKTGDTMVNDTDQWIAVAEGIRQQAPQTSLSIVLVVAQLGFESPRLERYRNDVASRLTGVPAKRANTEGIALLRQLIASAPASESEASLLPQQRTVFLLQALQKWVASSEDLNEEIDGLLAHLCTHLAPIIQSVPGAHWDLIFDLMESNLEAGSLRDRETYTTLQRTLLLILKVEELVATNKSLTALWSERRGEVLRLVANHLLVPSDDLPKNRRCRNLQHLLVSMAKDLSVPLSETEHFVLCDMMKEPSFALQEDVYEILCRLATQWNEQLVINAAVDTQADEEAKYELPRQLVALLQAVAPGDLDEESDSEEQARTTGYLLSWMLLFEFFDKISIKVRNSYLEQLRNLDLVSTSFVPKLLSLLKVTDGRKPFPVEPWAVDEFHLSLWDDSLPVRFQVLAVHAYYRSLIAVPPLVRAWFQECKDRNLTATLSAYTSKSFTPVLVAAEVAPLRSPESNEELADERFRVKIITAANDVSVSAAFIVDEQPMEIAVKFPSDYPLRPVGVEDVRRLNVPERKWRQWMLNILQAMQAGSVVDALSLWKRNVALHFEGITECAICYSIISVTDQTLPSKTCKTCSNKFHSGCLYKWFNTSHNSSCPLCRSDIL